MLAVVLVKPAAEAVLLNKLFVGGEGGGAASKEPFEDAVRSSILSNCAFVGLL